MMGWFIALAIYNVIILINEVIWNCYGSDESWAGDQSCSYRFPLII